MHEECIVPFNAYVPYNAFKQFFQIVFVNQVKDVT